MCILLEGTTVSLSRYTNKMLWFDRSELEKRWDIILLLPRPHYELGRKNLAVRDKKTKLGRRVAKFLYQVRLSL